jgi:UDP-galactopyranose mutase
MKNAMKEKKIAFAGAGFSSAVIARELANSGVHCILFEERDHIGGNCHTARDSETGVMVHTYGPHIFHTTYSEVWDYVNQFTQMMPFINRVKAQVNGHVYTLPINLHTINQFFGKAMSPAEARTFIDQKRVASLTDPKNFEEQGMASVGEELYRAFLYGYTKKQWGVEPSEIPASVLQRLPIRFNYNDNYFDHPFQGIPRHGYTALIENILKHPYIEVKLSTRMSPEEINHFDHTFWTGPIDSFYNHKHGRLTYRTVFFEKGIYDGDYQGNAVINYPDIEIPYTRISEHKHFAPWETHEKTVYFKEFSKTTDPGETPFYPVRKTKDLEILAKYEAIQQPKVTFVGRLGTYRYLDMDKTIYEALGIAKKFIENGCR